MQEIITGTGAILIYFVIAASSALTCRFLIRIPDEIFRKILHCILLGSLLIFIFCFDTWWIAVVEAIGFAIVVYPILMFFERYQTFSKLTTERKKGELKSSLLLVFFMFAAIITICWGFLGDRYLVITAVYAWGFGDAAAAIVGKRFGKHKITWKYTDGKKSLEGSAAMFVTSLISVAVILGCRGGLGTAGHMVIPLVVAGISALAELYSKEGMDTVICPFAAMSVLLPLVYLFGGLS